MNCKPGDLAIRIRSLPDASIKAGSIVRCLELVMYDSYCSRTGSKLPAGTVWLVEYNGETICPEGFPYGTPDVELKPIRGDEGDDETLQWAPVPVKENYHA